MSASHTPTIRRAPSGEAENSSGVNHAAFDYNLYSVHTARPHPRQGTQELDVNIGSQHKRVRHGPPHGSRPDVRRKLNPTMPDSFILPCGNTRFFPSQTIQRGTNEEIFVEEQVVPSLALNFFSEDMHRSMFLKNSSDSPSSKNKAAEPFVFGSTQSTKASDPTSKNGTTGTLSRRRPVPGENRPWLASTFRETTSSRGKDNPLNGRQPKAKQKPRLNVRAIAGPAPASNNLASNATTNNFNSEIGVDIISRDPISPMGSDKVVTPPQDWVLLDYTNIPSMTHLASTGPNSQPVRTTTEETASSNFQWHNNLSEMELETFSPYNLALMTNTNTAFGLVENFSADSQRAIDIRSDSSFMPQEYMDFDFLDAQGPFDFFGNHNYPNDFFDMQNLNNPNNIYSEQLDGWSTLEPIQEDSGFSGQVGNSQYSKTGLLTGDLSRIRNPHGRQQEQGKQIYATTNQLPYRELGSHSLPRYSPKPGVEDPPSLLIDTTEQNNITRGTPDFEELIGSGTDNSPDSLFDSTVSNTIPTDPNCQSRCLGDFIVLNHSYSDVNISAKSPSHGDSTKSHSPAPGLTENTNDIQREIQNPWPEANQQPRLKKSRRSSSSSSSQTTTTWNHTFVTQNNFTDAASVQILEGNSVNHAKRKGPLGDDKKERAKEMRKIGSCHRCRILKIALNVCTFHTPDQDFLAFKKIVTSDAGGVPTFTNYYSPPLGIEDLNQDLEGKLKNHISDIIKRQRNYGEVESGSMSPLSWGIYEAVRKYQARNPENQFLRNCLMLHAMQFFMTKSITILRESSENVLNNLPRPSKLAYSHNPNLRLINIQIKHIMYTLIQKMYFNVLEQLEKDLRPKEPAQWAPTFCCIMMLCMCAEMVQTTTDLRVVNALDINKAKPKSELDKNSHSPSREDSIIACRKLDELPIESATRIFHLVFKNNKTIYGSKRGEGFNPIHDGLGIVRNAHLGQDVESLVNDVLNVVKEHKNELNGRALTPSLNKRPNLLEDHTIFRKHNSGRLVAGFLISLL